MTLEKLCSYVMFISLAALVTLAVNMRVRRIQGKSVKSSLLMLLIFTVLLIASVVGLAVLSK